MTNVIGPISKEDWLDMRDFRSALSWLKAQASDTFKPGVDSANNSYKELKKKYVA